MCEAYEAARLQGETAGVRYLRRFREATAAEARQTNRVEVQAELATEVGLDLGRFLGALRDGFRPGRLPGGPRRDRSS